MEAARAKVLRVLDKEEARQLHPYLNWDTLGHYCTLEANARIFDVGGTLDAFLRGAKRNGVAIHCDAEVTGISKQAATGKWIVQSEMREAGAASERELECSFVVNAAGAWADETAEMAGVAPIGLIPRRRAAVEFVATQTRSGEAVKVEGVPWSWCLESVGKEIWYMSPRGASNVFLASPANRDDDEPCDCQVDDYDVALCMERTEELTLLQVDKLISKWAGHRCYSPDDHFVIGPDNQDPAFIWYAALQGQGIQSGPGTSEYLAAVIADKPLPALLSELEFDASVFSPARFRG